MYVDCLTLFLLDLILIQTPLLRIFLVTLAMTLHTTLVKLMVYPTVIRFASIFPLLQWHYICVHLLFLFYLSSLYWYIINLGCKLISSKLGLQSDFNLLNCCTTFSSVNNICGNSVHHFPKMFLGLNYSFKLKYLLSTLDASTSITSLSSFHRFHPFFPTEKKILSLDLFYRM